MYVKLDVSSWPLENAVRSFIYTALFQGLKKNKGNFTAEIVEAYKYVFSQPGAITAPLNYYRCLFKQRKVKKSAQKFEMPILIIWVITAVNWCDDPLPSFFPS